MKPFSGKFTGLLFAALIMVLTIATSESAQAQFTVCNGSAVPTQVSAVVNCGGTLVTLLPAPVLLAPGQCFTWPLTTTCPCAGVIVNGTFYPTPAAFPTCYPVPAPNPPNRVCFVAPCRVRIL